MENFWNNIKVVHIDGEEIKKIIFEMDLEEKKKVDSFKLYYAVEQMKDQGNVDFKKAWYTQAIKYYIIAQEICEALNSDPEKSEEADLKIHQEVCNNAALTFFKMGQFKHAIKHAKLGAKVPGMNQLKGKTHFLWAKALFELGKFEECLDHLQQADQLRDDVDPSFLALVKGKIEGMKKPENVTEDDTPEGASGNGGPTESNV